MLQEPMLRGWQTQKEFLKSLDKNHGCCSGPLAFPGVQHGAVVSAGTPSSSSSGRWQNNVCETAHFSLLMCLRVCPAVCHSTQVVPGHSASCPGRRSRGTREGGEQAEEKGCLPGSRQDRTQPFIQEERAANGDGKMDSKLQD